MKSLHGIMKIPIKNAKTYFSVQGQIEMRYRQTDKYTDRDYCQRRGSPSVYSSIERVVKITLQRTRHDNSQRTHSSLPLNRLIALIEKKKYLGSEGDARGEKSCAN